MPRAAPGRRAPPPTAMRVIAGEFGGRRLKAPRGMETRPTADRVREALFMALEPLADVRVVDLYSGSGALGIEALSRGAAFADFVDSDPRALAVLRENLELLEVADRSRVWKLALPRGLSRLRESLARADLVLLDPPYGGGRAEATLEALAATGALRAGARIVAEHGARDALPERVGRLARRRSRRYGQTLVTTYEVGETDAGPGPVPPEDGPDGTGAPSQERP